MRTRARSACLARRRSDAPWHIRIEWSSSAACCCTSADQARRYARSARARAQRSCSSITTPRICGSRLLHEVAQGGSMMLYYGLHYFLMAYWHHFRFRQGQVIGARPRAARMKSASCATTTAPRRRPSGPGALRHARVLRGQRQHDFGIPGVAERAISLDAADDAERVHRRLVAACARRRASGAWRFGHGRDRDHRRGRDRRRARGRNPPLHRRARELRAQAPAPRTRHSADARRGGATIRCRCPKTSRRRRPNCSASSTSTSARASGSWR